MCVLCSMEGPLCCLKTRYLIAVVVSFQVCAVQLLVQVPVPVLDISAQLQILLHLHSRLSGKLARFDGWENRVSSIVQLGLG